MSGCMVGFVANDRHTTAQHLIEKTLRRRMRTSDGGRCDDDDGDGIGDDDSDGDDGAESAGEDGDGCDDDDGDEDAGEVVDGDGDADEVVDGDGDGGDDGGDDNDGGDDDEDDIDEDGDGVFVGLHSMCDHNRECLKHIDAWGIGRIGRCLLYFFVVSCEQEVPPDDDLRLECEMALFAFFF